ncbi:hypothetical protein EVC24_066 [Rhizobium phage RHph_I4]|nr:hypothetical protein EVC24_066 [Rhizobium phage RHph_I4]
MDTVRERIMQHLKARYEARRKGVDGFNITWDYVLRRQPQKSEAREGNVLELIDVGEKKKPGIGYDMCFLRIVAEFHIKMMEGDEPSSVLNMALGDVVRTAGLDIQCGNLALNIEDEGNELDIDGANDNVVSGVVVFIVTYRCKSNDPTKKV